MEAEHHINCKVPALLIIILYWEWEVLQVYLTKSLAQSPRTEWEKGKQSAEESNAPHCTKIVTVPDALIYALAIKENTFGKQNFCLQLYHTVLQS